MRLLGRKWTFYVLNVGGGGGSPTQDQVKKKYFNPSLISPSRQLSILQGHKYDFTDICISKKCPYLKWRECENILILSWCLKVAVAGCSTPRDIWGDIAPYFYK